jgi:hypothetical protein
MADQWVIDLVNENFGLELEYCPHIVGMTYTQVFTDAAWAVWEPLIT